MVHRVLVLPLQVNMDVPAGDNLMAALQRMGIAFSAPCGGNGTCGKCKVLVDGKEALACRTAVDRDMTVTIPEESVAVLSDGIAVAGKPEGYALAFDIGTTTVAAYLLRPDGTTLAESALNPQAAFGADVVSRIRHAVNGQAEVLTDGIRRCADKLGRALCQRGGVFPQQIGRISLVGNPAMVQLFLGLSVENLAVPPYAPVLTKATKAAAKAILPTFSNAVLLTPPAVAGFVGADTLACVLATGMDQRDDLCLLVDIGTNGEMVLGDRHRMVATSTAAGPALEGAGIRCGMRAMEGAIDHVWVDRERFGCSVIGGEPAGICGTGLIDAVAAALDMGLLNERGKLSAPLSLTDDIQLTQEDIRALQQAKGAIAAGVHLLAQQLGAALTDIKTVYLAGAFGSYLEPASACRIGLLPAELAGRITAVGNAAGSGAQLLAQDDSALTRAEQLAHTIEHLNLATAAEFPRSFAKNMYFASSPAYWCRLARLLGFEDAAPLDPTDLVAREDVRAMCAEDKCGAYGKNHTCPPACGTLEQCARRMTGYRQGILLQTVGQLEKAIDSRGYRRAEQLHRERFAALCQTVRRLHPHALCLGAGGCRICRKCSYPEPCRFPEQAVSSMEAYGLFVTDVCRSSGLSYHHGEKTVTYTACILF